MEALLIALAAIAVLLVAALIGSLISKRAGYEASEWLGWLFGNVVFLCVFGGGVYVILWGIRIHYPVPILVGFAIVVFVGGYFWYSIRRGPGG
jgi:hypothetical protein